MKKAQPGSQERKTVNLTKNPGRVSMTELKAVAESYKRLGQTGNAEIMQKLLKRVEHKGRSLVRYKELIAPERDLVDAMREKAYEDP